MAHKSLPKKADLGQEEEQEEEHQHLCKPARRRRLRSKVNRRCASIRYVLTRREITERADFRTNGPPQASPSPPEEPVQPRQQEEQPQQEQQQQQENTTEDSEGDDLAPPAPPATQPPLQQNEESSKNNEGGDGAGKESISTLPAPAPPRIQGRRAGATVGGFMGASAASTAGGEQEARAADPLAAPGEGMNKQ
eukprot:scaffold160412_cov14-Tisochrysis_lutea.AAC.1